MTEYLDIERDYGLSAGRKTSVFIVYAKRDREPLGEIKWFGRWRQYTFWPYIGTVWNPDCMRLVADRCAELTSEHREQKVTQP